MASGRQFLTDGEPLPPNAVVVRWGVSAVETMKESAQDHYDFCVDEGRPGEYALSAEYRLGCTAEQIALRASARNAPLYRRLRETTVGELVEAGFEVVQDGRPGHASIKLGGPSSDARIRAIDDVFGDAKENPAWGGRA